MMKYKDLTELDAKLLIEIIEQPDHQDSDYQRKAILELKDRNLPVEKINELAISVNSAIAFAMLMNEDVSEEEVVMHKSVFLNKEEIKEIYIIQLEEYIKHKDQFRFDVWSYALGGG